MAAWDRNAEVFPNKGCTGSVDLILGIGGNYIPIDVKAMRWDPYKGIWKSAGDNPPEGVWLVLVNPETKQIRWANDHITKRPKCPNGLEDFWR